MITLNSFQSKELHEFMEKHASDEAAAVEFSVETNPVTELVWYQCKVPGTVAINDQNGYVLKLLLPEKPVAGDPLFQHAEGLSRTAELMGITISRGLWWMKDWQWEGALMDAPDEIPAGACSGFDYGDDVYGAYQLTWFRESY